MEESINNKCLQSINIHVSKQIVIKINNSKNHLFSFEKQSSTILSYTYMHILIHIISSISLRYDSLRIFPDLGFFN